MTDHGRAGVRRLTRPRSTPFDPAWLLERHLAPDVQRALAAYGHGLVVDVGCGGRPYEVCVPPDGRYVGIDLTPTLGSHPDCWARANALPFADGTASAVLCTQVLEHLPDPAGCVLESARILAAGGHLIITAPQTWNLHEAPHDYFRFTRFGLEELCRRAGLAVVLARPQGGLGASLGLSLLMFAGSRALGGDLTAGVAGRRPRLERVLRGVLAVHNLVFAVLDGWSGRGVGGGAFAVNHLVVAEKPGVGRDGPTRAREA